RLRVQRRKLGIEPCLALPRVCRLRLQGLPVLGRLALTQIPPLLELPRQAWRRCQRRPRWADPAREHHTRDDGPPHAAPPPPPPSSTGPATARRHHVARVPRLAVLMISCFMTFSCLLVGPTRRAGPIAGDPSVGVSLLRRSIGSHNVRSHPRPSVRPRRAMAGPGCPDLRLGCPGRWSGWPAKRERAPGTAAATSLCALGTYP